MAIFFLNYKPTGYLLGIFALYKSCKQLELISVYKWTAFNHVKQNHLVNSCSIKKKIKLAYYPHLICSLSWGPEIQSFPGPLF